MTDHPTLTLCQELIARRSVTPEDDGCQAMLATRLGDHGLVCESMRFGEVSNLWAQMRGEHGPLLIFAGHTDVVPSGPLERWRSDPFQPTIRDGRLYGRGAADMKSSIAAFVVALEQALAQGALRGRAALLLTSDEEGPSVDGTVKVVQALSARGVHADYCIVGEPTSVGRLGDTLKNGRRGSLSARLVVHGQQGHIAYPHLADNPVHRLAPALAELVATRWDDGNAFFPATTWQVSNIHAGTGANNVIPGDVTVDFNFRYSSSSTAQALRERLEAVLIDHGLRFSIDWRLSGEPFLTEPGELSDALRASIAEHAGVQAELSTTGGTSDGRFIAKWCQQVIEFGPCNESIHKIDEFIELDDLPRLTNIYRGVIERLLR
ncbi:MAG: succinyl-diaminopimelate desuccinylase [Burkholderiaceae bacterium]